MHRKEERSKALGPQLEASTDTTPCASKTAQRTGADPERPASLQGKNLVNTRRFPKWNVLLYQWILSALRDQKTQTQTMLKKKKLSKTMEIHWLTELTSSGREASFRHGWIQDIEGWPRDPACTMLSPMLGSSGSTPKGSRWSPAAMSSAA